MNTAVSHTAGSIIDELGGTGAVADGLALADSTVSSWRERGLPAGRCLALAELAKRRGRSDITLEVLLRAAERPAQELRT